MSERVKGRREGGGDVRAAKFPFKCQRNKFINKYNLLIDLRSLVTSRLRFIIKVLSEEVKQYLYSCPFPSFKVAVGVSRK